MKEILRIRLGGGGLALGKISTLKATNFTLPNLCLMLNVGSNPFKLNKLKTVPREVARWIKPNLPQTEPRNTLTRLAVSEGADWPKAWLRMRTRLDVSADADQVCPAVGFGRRYLPARIKEKTM